MMDTFLRRPVMPIQPDRASEHAREMLQTEREERLRQTAHGEHYCGGAIMVAPGNDTHSCTGMCGGVDIVIDECMTCEEDV